MPSCFAACNPPNFGLFLFLLARSLLLLCGAGGAASKLQPRLPSHGLHRHLRSTFVPYVLDCSIPKGCSLASLIRAKGGQEVSGSGLFRLRAPPRGLSSGQERLGRGGGWQG